MTGWVTVVGAVVSVIGAVVVALVGKRSSSTAKKIETTTPPYDALAKRVSTLEAQVDEDRKQLHGLSTDLDLVVDAMHEQVEWQDAGANPPPRAIKAHVREVVQRRREALEA